MIHLATFVFCLAGFAALALATERQQEIVYGRVLDARSTRRLRWLGWGALVVGLIVPVWGWGWAYGLVVYSGYTSLCAGLTFVALVVRGQRAAARR